MRNRWKTAFWLILILLFMVTGLGIYSIIDQGVTLTYRKDSFEKQEQDLTSLQEIINKSAFQKQKALEILKVKGYIIEDNLSADSIELNNKTLIFKDDRLTKVVDR